MRTLMVCESMFGNTHAVAEAVVATLSRHGRTDLVDVAGAPVAIKADVDLVVVGAPTHAFGLSRPNTRESAVKQGAPGDVESVGVREWLATLAQPAGPTGAAAFDTRVARPRVPGSAARAAGRRLTRLGFQPVAKPVSFWVESTTGPLRPGELERARRWAEDLAQAWEAVRQSARTVDQR
jgi:hypothetical protein